MRGAGIGGAAAASYCYLNCDLLDPEWVVVARSITCCDVQARLEGLHQAVYVERDRLLDAINEADAHARARML